MDDCDGPNTYIATREKMVTEKVDSGMLTDPREYRNQGLPELHYNLPVFSENFTFPSIPIITFIYIFHYILV